MQLGVIVVADGLFCLASPSLLLTTYARQVAGWSAPRIPAIAAFGMRLVAVLAIAAAGFYAFDLSRSVWDVGALLVFGAFGVACKAFGWNRLVLILAFAYGALLEQTFRRSMLLSQGDPAVFFQRPISGLLLLLAVAIVVVAAALSMWRMVRRRQRGGEQS